MSSKEFINKEIQRINNIIRVTKNDIAFITENKRDTSQLQVKVIVLENHLNSLHQIKTILEAWEVVKKNIVIDITDSLYTIQIYKQDEECKTFEKALEVKDEKEN